LSNDVDLLDNKYNEIEIKKEILENEPTQIDYSGEFQTCEQVFAQYLCSVGKEQLLHTNSSKHNDNNNNNNNNNDILSLHKCEEIWHNEKLSRNQKLRCILEEEKREKEELELNIRRSRRRVSKFYNNKNLPIATVPCLDSTQRNATWHLMKKISYSKLKEICQSLGLNPPDESAIAERDRLLSIEETNLMEEYNGKEEEKNNTNNCPQQVIKDESFNTNTIKNHWTMKS